MGVLMLLSGAEGYGYYMDVQDWVEFRETLAAAGTFADWKANRTANDTLSNPKEWLVASKWKSLGARLEALTSEEEAAEEIPAAAEGECQDQVPRRARE